MQRRLTVRFVGIILAGLLMMSVSTAAVGATADAGLYSLLSASAGPCDTNSLQVNETYSWTGVNDGSANAIEVVETGASTQIPTRSGTHDAYATLPIPGRGTYLVRFIDPAGDSSGVRDLLVNCNSDAGAFGHVSRFRVLDTRNGIGAANAAVSANGSVTVAVAGVGGLPDADLGAVAVNLTVASPTAAGYLTAYADGTDRPNTSNVNYTKGQTVANLTMIPVGADGKIKITNSSSGSVQLVADISGYYLAGTSSAGGFNPVPPVRGLDTRTGTGAAKTPIAAGGSVTVKVTGVGGVNPASTGGAVVMNLTATAPNADGYLTAYPDGLSRPSTSALNYAKGQTVANLAIVPIGADGRIKISNASSGTVQVVADIVGYYSYSGFTGDMGEFSTATPFRVLDTRTGTGAAKGANAPNGSLSVNVTGAGGLPDAGIGAVVVNLTVATPTAAGYLTAYADELARPGTSDLNYAKGQTVANLAVVPVGADGKIKITNNSGGSVQLIADVVGYYMEAGAPPDLLWRSRPAESVIPDSAVVSCATTTFCIAVYGDDAVRFDGTTWHAPQEIGFAASVSGVSCSSTTFCVAVNGLGQAAEFDGTAWTTPQTVDPGMDITSLSCVDDGFCVAADNGGNALAFDGLQWKVTSGVTPEGSMPSVSCVNRSFCMLVELGGDAKTFDGTTWSAPREASPDSLNSVSCASRTFCGATGGYTAVTFDGTRWSKSRQIEPGNDSNVQGLSCVSGSYCVGVDYGTGSAITFNPDGSPIGDGLGPDLEEVSCVTYRFCVAVGDGGKAFVGVGRG